MSYNGYPEHIELEIDLCNLPKIWKELENRGFRNTIFQILSPKQIYGNIKVIEYNGGLAELHVRCLIKNGTQAIVLAEYEPKRLGNVLQHLSRHSYSAHDYLIELMNMLEIPFSVDEKERIKYNENVPDNFPRQKFKFFHWFFIGGLLILPRGIIWRIIFEIKQKFSKKKLFDHCNEDE